MRSNTDQSFKRGKKNIGNDADNACRYYRLFSVYALFLTGHVHLAPENIRAAEGSSDSCREPVLSL
jgi:hypothetical protein